MMLKNVKIGYLNDEGITRDNGKVIYSAIVYIKKGSESYQVIRNIERMTGLDILKITPSWVDFEYQIKLTSTFKFPNECVVDDLADVVFKYRKYQDIVGQNKVVLYVNKIKKAD